MRIFHAFAQKISAFWSFHTTLFSHTPILALLNKALIIRSDLAARLSQFPKICFFPVSRHINLSPSSIFWLIGADMFNTIPAVLGGVKGIPHARIADRR
jgi:hypothetical protein